jgi:hypothetical protein
MCQHCQLFLYDFLIVPPHKDLPLTKQIRVTNLQKILPEFVDWSLRLNARIQQDDFNSALLTSSRIARRGRSLHEYECILHTATSNFLRCSLPWLSSEIDYMKLLLVDAGVIKGRGAHTVLRTSQDYLHYSIPRILVTLRDLHDDHRNPKGLSTDLNKLFLTPRATEESDLDDLYT